MHLFLRIDKNLVKRTLDRVDPVPSLASSYPGRLGDPASSKDVTSRSSCSSNNVKDADEPSSATYSYKSQGNPPEVVYVRDQDRANLELARLFKADCGPLMSRVVGLDVEWCPSFRGRENKVALVQIAATRKILLLHLSAMKEFPERLTEFLMDETIIKVGVGILCDAQRMYRDFSLTTRSCLELSYLARALDSDQWPGPLTDLIGLSRLVGAYLGCSLPKDDLQTSNWEDRLTKEQIKYAANDAHAGMTIGIALLERADLLDRSLFMFDVVRANAVGADGQAWYVRRPTSTPPPTLPPDWNTLSTEKMTRLRAWLESEDMHRKMRRTSPVGFSGTTVRSIRSTGGEFKLDDFDSLTQNMSSMRIKGHRSVSEAGKKGSMSIWLGTGAESNADEEVTLDPFGWPIKKHSYTLSII